MQIHTLGGRLGVRSLSAVGAATAAVLVIGSLWQSDADARYAKVAHLLSRDSFAAASPMHQQMLVDAVEDATARDVQCCFAPGTALDQAFIDAFNLALQGGPGTAFQIGTRWGNTAMTPGPLNLGDPTTITYSFVADGVSIPSSGIGSTGPNNLQATFNGLFGSPTTWQQFWHDAFASWGELCGIDYVFEPNDDGAPIFTSPGVVGVRGDVRIAGRRLDGPSGVLAFNNFPNNGDMVMDTADTGLWGNSANNFRILRNTIMHEHGHGMGLFHVCPINNSKLMEPFLSSAFDGPQLDEISGANRMYGDRLEPNDIRGQSHNLGVLPTSAVTLDNLSIDNNADSDWYEFFIGQRRDMSIVVTPIGATYSQGPQTQQCNSGTSFDSLRIQTLGFELTDSAGTVITSASASGPGAAASTFDFPLNATGTFHIRVFGGGTNNVQLYQLQVDNDPFTVPPFSISLPAGAPDSLTPGADTIVDVQTINGLSSPDRANAVLRLSINGGPFLSRPLLDLGGSNGFQALLPSQPTLSEIDWYISIPPTGGGAPLVEPFGAPAAGVFHSAYDGGGALTPVFTDNFNTDQGWTIANDPGVTGGQWQRASPSGGGGRGDPPSDSDGSGLAYVTEDGAGNTDLDGGRTILTSPPIDISAFSQAVVRFDFWYSNDFGASPNLDVFRIEIDDGTGFAQLEAYNNNAGAWLSRSFIVQPAVPTTALRIRFIAEDLDPGSIIEAGVDAVEVLGVAPQPGLDPGCRDGTAGAGGELIFLVNRSTGGERRRVEYQSGQGITLGVESPSTVPAGVPFVMLASLGVPGPLNQVPAPGIGTFCIPLGAIAIGPLFIGPTPTPWEAFFRNGILGPAELTLQAVVIEDPVTLRITNGITLSIAP